jgi:hypothetical protein
MSTIYLTTLCLMFVWLTQAAFAIDPVPETQQAALAMKILTAYRQSRPTVSSKELHVVYFTPSDRDPELRYRERLDAILADIRAFYRDGMERAGFGPMTFDLAHDADGKLIIHLVKGKKPEKNYNKPDADKVIAECQPVLKAAGISLERETVLISCNLATWDEQAKTFSHHSPYYGLSYGASDPTRGLCFVLDSVIQNLEDIPKNEPFLQDDEYGKMSLGKFNTVFIGGIAHEMGHAFSLPHCGERWDENRLGTSLMGVGNHTYREERRGEGPGSFLTMASAMRLAGRPLFSKSEKEITSPPRLEKNEFQLSTNVTQRDLLGRPGALRVEGTVKGTPPVYGVIAYFDSLRDGGYHAPTATAVPDSEGGFAMEVSDLAPCRNGELRLEYCHANGAVSERYASFKVTKNKTMDLEQWETAKALEPLSKAVAHENLKSARAELRKIDEGRAPELAKIIARKLVATLQNDPKPLPADVAPAIAELPLGDAQASTAEVGWLKPSANRIPANDQVESPVLDAGKIYATGLYAHAPSRYIFDLGGKWKTLRGEAGLHTTQQSYGSVVFLIKTEGKEIFRSSIIRQSATASYDVDVTGVKILELVVEDGGDGNHNDWGLWLDPTLLR